MARARCRRGSPPPSGASAASRWWRSQDSPAATSGLRPEDLVVAIDGLPVRGVDDMHRLLTGERIGRDCELTVVRNGGELAVAVTPRELS